MLRRMYAAFIMSLGVAVTLASNQAFGQQGAAPLASMRSAGPSLPSVSSNPSAPSVPSAPFFRTARGFHGARSFHRPLNHGLDLNEYRDITRFTCSYDIPWDWVHRCPPVASPLGPPPTPVVSAPVISAPGCVQQDITVPGTDGKNQTITMLRC